jgi:hypothetical protein
VKVRLDHHPNENGENNRAMFQSTKQFHNFFFMCSTRKINQNLRFWSFSSRHLLAKEMMLSPLNNGLLDDTMKIMDDFPGGKKTSQKP